MTKGRQIRAIGDAAAESPVDGTIESAEGGAAESSATPGQEWEPSWEEPAPPRSVWPTIIGVLAMLLVLGWTGFFGWTNRSVAVAGAAPAQWIAMIGQWAVPVLLVGVAWLIAMRGSTREARRFGDAAQSLARESALLEERLVHVNRELSLAREFLAAQSRELDYVGRSASERIAEHAGKLQALVAENGAQVDAIAGVSVTALENMSQLRDNLPVIANSARDVTNQIGGAGRSAKAQLADLVSGFERLNEFGQASERQVVSLRERIDGALQELGSFAATMDASNSERIAALKAETEAMRGELEAREQAMLDAIRERAEAMRAELAAAHAARQLEEATALASMRGQVSAFTQEAEEAAAAIRDGERAALEAWESQIAGLRTRLEETLAEVAELDRKALEAAREKLTALTQEAEDVDARLLERDRDFGDRIAKRREEFDRAETLAFARLTERAEALDRDVATRQETQIAHAELVSERNEALSARLAEIEAQIASVSERSKEAEGILARGADHFAATVTNNSAQLTATEAALDRLTDASVRLLELIQGAAQHSRAELPSAIEAFEARLATARAHSSEIREALEAARGVGDELVAGFAGMQDASDTATGGLDALRSRLSGTVTEQRAALALLRDELAATGDQNRSLAASIAGELATAIAQLKSTSQSLLDDLETGQSTRIAAIAERIGDESAAAIDRAVEARAGEVVARLDEATAKSGDAARAAIAQLRDQLARVHELTTNLETRAARAREQVEEQVDNDFARRMALITESLNSHSIDIAKALSTEVTDTAWASYLKGDRGVFTRRAVRLIDNGEARQISQLYEDDHEFRDHVSRYIHDFEAMLRTMLSTRDGHALGVTLLSSDMGKLYVALAQAIQRLRQ